MYEYFVPTEIGELGVRKPAYEPDQEIAHRRYGRMGCVVGVEDQWDDPPEDVSLLETGVTVEESEDDENVEIAEYVCDECGEEFESQQGLAGHSRVHL
jgi:hypothetical protein